MNSSNKKKMSKSSIVLQEVADYLEEKSPDEFELYGQRLYDLADEIDALLTEIEENESEDEEDNGFNIDD